MARVINDPAKALVLVGKENTEMKSELEALYPEIDRYRIALTTILEMPAEYIVKNPGKPGEIAKAALAQKSGAVIKPY